MAEERRSGHRRRVHYAGRYPRRFEEKYKEHAPEKYADTVEHIIDKGSTPAGMHIPICVDEILSILAVQPGERGLDCTLGYGGHSRRLLERLAGRGHLTSLDIDPIESVKTEARLRALGYGEDIFSVRRINFAEIDRVAEEQGRFDFVLADLGVSSMQIDDPARGFSYKVEGPLDLRMNPERGMSAAERLRELSREEIEGMLRENADEPYAHELAAAITRCFRAGKCLDTTSALRELIEQTLGALKSVQALSAAERKEELKKSCQRSFQALRIDINHEYEVLEQLLTKLPGVLNPGGRVAILSFHSGEDRLVKRSFKELKRAGIYAEIAEELTRPSAEECVRNPRARSAKLRWAVRGACAQEAPGWSS